MIELQSDKLTVTFPELPLQPKLSIDFQALQKPALVIRLPDALVRATYGKRKMHLVLRPICFYKPSRLDMIGELFTSSHPLTLPPSASTSPEPAQMEAGEKMDGHRRT
jgi:hypothetical protein